MNFPQRARKASLPTPSRCLAGLSLAASRRSVLHSDAKDRRRSLTGSAHFDNCHESRAGGSLAGGRVQGDTGMCGGEADLTRAETSTAEYPPNRRGPVRATGGIPLNPGHGRYQLQSRHPHKGGGTDA